MHFYVLLKEYRDHFVYSVSLGQEEALAVVEDSIYILPV